MYNVHLIILCIYSNDSTSTSETNVLDHELTVELRDMLDSINPLVAQFRMAGEQFVSAKNWSKFKLCLIGTRERDGREYNLPTADEVVALVVGDVDETINKKDIILHMQEGVSRESVNYILLIWHYSIRYCFHMLKMDIELIYITEV